jgi:hypothetical protein
VRKSLIFIEKWGLKKASFEDVGFAKELESFSESRLELFHGV